MGIASQDTESDDHNRQGFRTAASVAMIADADFSKCSPEQKPFVKSILAACDSITESIPEMDRTDLAALMQCPNPDPDYWHEVEPNVLEQSAQIVGFLATQVTLADEADRDAGRMLLLSIECIGRLKGDSTLASLIMEVPPAEDTTSPNSLFREGRLGFARAAILARIEGFATDFVAVPVPNWDGPTGSQLDAFEVEPEVIRSDYDRYNSDR